ncbi:MAG: SCO family protein [Microthrixaceae bacterium]
MVIRPRIRPRAVLLVVVGWVCVVAAACSGPSDDGASGAGSPSTLGAVVRDDPLRVGQVTLPEVTGGKTPTPFAMTARSGGLLVTFFGYTNCPDVCPTTLAGLRTAYRGLGDAAARIHTAMVTVDPDRDTPEVMTRYLASFFPARYHALRTLDDEALRAAEGPFLATSSVSRGLDGTVEVTHTGTTYVIDSSGTVLAEWPFGTDAATMRNDLLLLLRRVGGAT